MPSFRVHWGDSISVVRCCQMRDRIGVSARIVANTAVAKARRRRFFEPIDGVAVPAVEAPVDLRIDVGTLLRGLAPRQRAVLHLTAVEGYSDREIGEALGISSSSVRVHRLRARRRLAELNRGGENDE